MEITDQSISGTSYLLILKSVGRLLTLSGYDISKISNPQELVDFLQKIGVVRSENGKQVIDSQSLKRLFATATTHSYIYQVCKAKYFAESDSTILDVVGGLTDIALGYKQTIDMSTFDDNKKLLSNGTCLAGLKVRIF